MQALFLLFYFLLFFYKGRFYLYRKTPPIFCLLLVLFFGAEANAPLSDDSSSTGDFGSIEMSCFENLGKLSSLQVQKKCKDSCDGSDNELDKLSQCVKRVCQEQCQGHITTHLSACKGLQYNHNPCNSLCSMEYPVFDPDGQGMQVAQRRCAQNNREQVKQSLVQQCQVHLKQLSQGRGTLICPGGNNQNPNCENFCEKQAQSNMANTPCLEDQNITKSIELNRCQTSLISQIQQALPRNQELAQKKGFSFQKCALSMPCEWQLQQYFQTSLNHCQQFNKKAKTCCSEPLKCLPKGGGGGRPSSLNINIGASISQSCAQLQQSLSQAGQVSQQMANTCQKMAQNCSQSCSQWIASYIQKPFLDTCAFDLTQKEEYDPARHTCAQSMIFKYTTHYQQKIIPLLSSCKTEEQKSQSLAQNASELLKSALSAGKCQKEASAGLAIKSSSSSPSAKQANSNNLNSPSAMGGFSGDFNNNPTITKKGGFSEGGGESAQKAFLAKNNGFSSTTPKVGKNGLISPPIGKKEDGIKREPSSFLRNKKASSPQGGLGIGAKNTLATGLNNTLTVGAINQKRGLDSKNQNNPAGFLDKNFANQKKRGNDTTSQIQTNNSQVGGGDGQNPYLKFTPRGVSALDSFGSRFDNIFNRISNRITMMCQQKKLKDCPSQGF